MTTATGHTSAILASKVKGTAVYNTAGDKIGHVEDVVLDKQSDHIMFAALGFGGVMGIGEKYYPVPWSVLDYSPDKGGYVVPMSKADARECPGLQSRRSDQERRPARRHPPAVLFLLQREARLVSASVTFSLGRPVQAGRSFLFASKQSFLVRQQTKTERLATLRLRISFEQD